VVEVGDHLTLLNEGGEYSTLWNMQAEKYQERSEQKGKASNASTVE
jgi:hypothetical protein